MFSTTLQSSPGVVHGRPENGKQLNASSNWYMGLDTGNMTVINAWYGEKTPGYFGVEYFEDAISAETALLDDSYFEEQHIYRLEWQPKSAGRYTSCMVSLFSLLL